MDLLCTGHCYIISLNSHTSDEEAITIPILYMQTKELRKVTDCSGDLAGSRLGPATWSLTHCCRDPSVCSSYEYLACIIILRKNQIWSTVWIYSFDKSGPGLLIFICSWAEVVGYIKDGGIGVITKIKVWQWEGEKRK